MSFLDLPFDGMNRFMAASEDLDDSWYVPPTVDLNVPASEKASEFDLGPDLEPPPPSGPANNIFSNIGSMSQSGGNPGPRPSMPVSIGSVLPSRAGSTGELEPAAVDPGVLIYSALMANEVKLCRGLITITSPDQSLEIETTLGGRALFIRLDNKKWQLCLTCPPGFAVGANDLSRIEFFLEEVSVSKAQAKFIHIIPAKKNTSEYGTLLEEMFQTRKRDAGSVAVNIQKSKKGSSKPFPSTSYVSKDELKGLRFRAQFLVGDADGGQVEQAVSAPFILSSEKGPKLADTTDWNANHKKSALKALDMLSVATSFWSRLVASQESDIEVDLTVHCPLERDLWTVWKIAPLVKLATTAHSDYAFGEHIADAKKRREEVLKLHVLTGGTPPYGSVYALPYVEDGPESGNPELWFCCNVNPAQHEVLEKLLKLIPKYANRRNMPTKGQGHCFVPLSAVVQYHRDFDFVRPPDLSDRRPDAIIGEPIAPGFVECSGAVPSGSKRPVDSTEAEGEPSDGTVNDREEFHSHTLELVQRFKSSGLEASDEELAQRIMAMIIDNGRRASPEGSGISGGKAHKVGESP
jgi:hypothetical protein